MILGVFLRYIKTYKGNKYIPISESDPFCGLLGNNGVGKSSILEALDSFFNSKSFNFNLEVKEKGITDRRPNFVPVFVVDKSNISANNLPLAEKLSSIALSIKDTDVSPSNKQVISDFIRHRDLFISKESLGDRFLIPLGVDYDAKISFSVFVGKNFVAQIKGDSEQYDSNSHESFEEFKPLLEDIKNSFEYVYIPKEIDPETFTKLEVREIQALMGQTLYSIISEVVTSQNIDDINKGLNGFINNLNKELSDYSYRTPGTRQQNLRKNDIYNLIIEAFFSTRKLHKKLFNNYLDIGSLSSGEKQRAIIDIASSLISHHRQVSKSLIIAIDEPESSLHISACFEQFSVLFEMSRSCRQMIFSSHWYGFLPTIENGSVTVISKEESSHVAELILLGSYREQIKQLRAKTRDNLPFDIKIKSINDFTQSIISSVVNDDPYNWLICEGSSEKIYFSKYFEDLISTKKLRIVPVGGASEVKKVYEHLFVASQEIKNDIKGKIFLLIDTDAELVSFDAKNNDFIKCKRLVSYDAEKKTKLVNVDSNPKSPATAIENCLDGKVFYDTLFSFVEDEPSLLFLHAYIPDNLESRYCLDLRSSEIAAIDSFLSSGLTKFKFSNEYVRNLASSQSASVPEWIEEIKKYFNGS